MKAIATKGNYAVYVGIVVAEKQIPKENGDMRYVVTVEDYKSDKKDFWFSNDNQYNPPAKNADRAIAQKIKIGDFVAIKALAVNEPSNSCSAYEIRKRGRISLLGEGKQINVVIGSICNPKAPKDNMFCVSMPLYVKSDNGEIEERWYDITFFNGSKEDPSAPNGKREWRYADHVKKAMKDCYKANAAIVVGEQQVRTHNGKTYYSYVGTAFYKH